MVLFDSPLGIFSAFFLLCIGVVFAIYFARYFRVPVKMSLVLYLWHTMFCGVYIFYAQHNPADANMYYQASLDLAQPFSVGTASVIYFTSLFSQVFGLSYLGTFLVFNIIGFVGLLALYGSLKAVTFDKPKWVRLFALLIVLLPSISFWSTAIGKDAIAFLATALALWASLDFQRRLKLIFFAIALMFFVRPHMAGLLVIALSAALTMHPKARLVQRVVYGTAVIALGAMLVPFALNYAGVDGDSVGALTQYIASRQSTNLHGGGAVNIASMSTPMQLFTYMFRPLPFEVGSVPQLAAALDNMVLLFLFIVGGAAMFRGRRTPLNEDRIFLWVYSLLAWIILAKVTANLGIAVRQKWMFAPMLMFLFLSVMGRGQRRNRLGVRRSALVHDDVSKQTTKAKPVAHK